MKLKLRVRPAEWKPTEDAACIQLFKAGKTFQQIADDPQIIGRNEAGVRARLIHLKQILPDSSRFWTDDEDKVVTACLAQSESFSSIVRGRNFAESHTWRNQKACKRSRV